MIDRPQTASSAQLTPLKQALLALRDMRTRLEAVEHARNEPIAMIGMGCRLPGGANDPQSFWRLLHDGVDAITEMPRDRWDVDAYYDPDPEAPGKMSTRWGGFIEGIDQFDAAFFGISPTEAVSMDPQQRFLLEVAQEAFDDAGLPRERLAGSKTGVFVGLAHSEYAWLNLSNVDVANAYSATGSFGAISANRMSYVYDLRGPSYTVDAVCSSSLLAVHLACESLRRGECRVALAAGAGLFLRPEGFVWFTKLGVMSPDGRCRAFDAHGNGIVLSEGVAAVVLKPLSTALADGDPIYAVIRGSGVAQDGRSNGLTAPSREAQEAMLREAYQRAGVDPREVQYVETHGTGTVLGDPIEAHALGAVLGRERTPDRPCRLGSVKTNLGHMQTVGGLVGAMKVALSMRHRQLPPSLHFTAGSAHIPFADLRLRVQDELGPWPYGERLLAGVTSLSFGGTNVHVVMEEPPSTPPAAPAGATDRALLLPLSAHTPTALVQVVEGYRRFLQDNDDSGSPADLEDLCYTASTRRSHYDRRLAVAFRSRSELIERLAAFSRHEARPGLVSGNALRTRRKLTFVFSGQGGQWDGMGRQLLESEPVFRAAIERIDRAFGQYADWSILDELTAPIDRSRLDRIDVVQPVVFSIQVALAALWKSWGVVPDAVVGHSMGEVAAACVAGALTIEDAARLIFERSRLLARLRGQGAMAVVELGLDEARACLAGYTDRLSVAASNSPTSSVLSGDPTALQDVLAVLTERGVFSRRIHVDVAAHSPFVAPLRAELRELLKDIQPQAASVPMYSTVSGDRIDGKALTPAYWARNLGEPVLFSTAMLRLLEAGHQSFVEIGPHPTLLGAIEQSAQRAGKQVTVAASLKRGENEQVVLRTTLGTLYTQGHSIGWQDLYPSAGRQVVRLPSYPWQHRRFWLDGSRLTWSANGVHTNRAVPGQVDVDDAVDPLSPGPGALERSAADAAVLDRAQLLALGPGVRRAALTEYLRERIAESLGLSSAELNVDEPLTALGLNSLMIFELQSRLKSAYGGGISTDEFAAGITVAEVVTRILQQLDTAPEQDGAVRTKPAAINVDRTSLVTPPASIRSADWVSRPDPRPDASLRLLCLPYAGGGASIFREWSNALPPDVEVCALQLPGREQRFREAPYRQLTALVQTLAKVIEPYVDRPFAIFGHSMGGLVGFELARQCRRQGLPEPVRLFVSASRAPHVLDDGLPLHRLPEPQLVAKLRELSGTPEEMLANPEIMGIYLPLLRADFTVVETYVYRAEEPLGCPISAFGGEQDDKIGTEALDAWRTQTRATFTRQLFPGNHFFLHSARAPLLAAVAQDLAPAYPR